MNIFFFALIIILVNILIFINIHKIKSLIKIVDDPKNELRKIHKKPISSIGGVWLMFNFLIMYLISYNFFNINIFNEPIHNLKNFTSLWLGLSSLFIIGVYDDKYKIKTSLKSILLFFSIISVLLLDDDLILNTIHLSFMDISYSMGSLAFPFTLLSMLLFINAVNLYDGIDLQLGLYSLSVIGILIFLELTIYFLLPVLIFLIFFLILNHRKKIFLGDNGSYVLGFFFSYLFIKSYNSQIINYADEIFLIMILPGFDMLRIFFVRTVHKQNPFSPDQNHIHHLLLNDKKNNILQVNIITLFLGIFPFVISQMLQNNVIALFFFLIAYSFVILFRKKLIR
jgi:UDP-GlcNAc:undecaprenyl-phosphate GlcNAc-1-phosphate transferase